MPLQGDAIWLPGAGVVSIDERAAAKAVEEYDPDLMLGQRRDTNEWCVFLPGNRHSDGQPFPVFTFGTTLPHPDDIKRKLYEADVLRNGRELLDQLDRIHEQEQARLKTAASDAAEQVADAIDSNMRLKGVHPFPRVYMGGKFGGKRIRSSG